MSLVEAVLKLALASPIHRWWPLINCYNVFVPPIMRGQTAMVSGENGTIVAFASYASISDEAQVAFKSRPLQADEWNSGPNLWLMDVIAPHGHTALVTATLRKYLRTQGFQGRKLNFRRRYADGRVRYSGVVI